MSTINDGGPAFQCSVCGDQAIIKQGNQHLCAKHYRFGQMRANAKRNGKTVPSRDELESIMPKDLVCPDCSRQMNWRSADGQATVASLQHYRNGTYGIVCRSCNTRHAFMEGDSYREMQKDHKQCPQCKQIKPHEAFAVDNGRTGPIKLKSWCKQCSSASHTKWQRNNREHYNNKQREGRARRSAG